MENEKKNPPAKKKKAGTRTWALAAGAGVFALVLLAGVVALFIDNLNAKRELENIYERTFYELTDATSNLEMSLSKMLVATDDGQSSVLSMDVYRNAETALDAITRLPLQRVDVEGAEKFFNQVGDFSMSFNKNAAYGKDSSAYRDKLEDLYIVARNINQAVLAEGEELRGNGFNYTAMLGMRYKRAKTAKAGEGANSENSYQSVEYPELIYDGPFSDSTSKRCYKALENLEEISYEQACQKIAKMIPYDVNSFENAGLSGGMAPSYQILFDTAAGQMHSAVTKSGGHILNCALYRPIGDITLNEEGAKAKAKEYAAKLGFNVEPVWYNSSEGIAVVNLAPIKNEIVYYTDLVKIKVALDDGSFLGSEANGFCMNNCERAYTVSMTPDSAKSVLPKFLTVNSVRLAVVPDNEKEVLTYEIAAEYKGLDYFIYVDAANGRQVNIMRVIDSEQGKMSV